MGFIREMSEDWTGRFCLLVIVVLIAMIPICIYGSIMEARQWEAFSIAHGCKIVAHMKGDTQTGVGYGMTANGQFGTVITTSSTPDKTAWLCNDGVTYWR